MTDALISQLGSAAGIVTCLVIGLRWITARLAEKEQELKAEREKREQMAETQARALLEALNQVGDAVSSLGEEIRNLRRNLSR